MPKVKETILGKLGVCPGDCVVAHHKLFCQGSDAGHHIAMLQDACLDRMPYLLHKLQIEGLPRRLIQVEGHSKLYR